MSLILSVKLLITNTNEVHFIKALLDCGATGSFIDKDFVYSKRINTQSISYPIPVFNVDRFPNKTD